MFILTLRASKKIRTRLASYSVDPFDLSIVNQTGCPKEGEAGWNIHIDPDTFSTRNIANAFRKAGEAIGDGFEAAVNAGKKIYNKYRDGDSDEMEAEVPRIDRILLYQYVKITIRAGLWMR
uniref:Uncharacterized protein n=1 Tax=Anopheles melas TaxID=34690 RepID=A0A182UDK1_9DIPT